MDQRNLRGQGAMEFMIMAGIGLLVFVLLGTVVVHEIGEQNRAEEELRGRDVAVKVQKEINIAARASEGYMRTFCIPSRLGTIDYNISLLEKDVLLRSASHTHYLRIPPVFGNVSLGCNTIIKNMSGVFIT